MIGAAACGPADRSQAEAADSAPPARAAASDAAAPAQQASPTTRAAQTAAAPGRRMEGPLRVLFLGHPPNDHPGHKGHESFPIIAQAFGRDAIYIDYTDDLDLALSADYLNRFDALLLYANYNEMSDAQFDNLKNFVESGRGFLPIHMASASFVARKEFIELVGGQFEWHGARVFSTDVIAPDHPAMAGVEPFESWDETYVHKNHNEAGRTVLMTHSGEETEEPEPWTWVREQGEGRVFYTASGHDERTWTNPGFQQLLKSGILWAVGDERRQSYEAFLESRTPLVYEDGRGNIPNYEKRPEPLAYQRPLSAEDSMDYIQVPAEFSLELVAAEPLVIKPISMAWDERGRLWVAESVDYPNEIFDEGGNDRIVILTDVNGDGKMDQRTVFADGLNIPTSIVHANGGLIVAAAPNIYFMKDTDGDGVADVKEVILTGWSKFDTHAGPSNLRYGLDNWIYGTVGYAGFQEGEDDDARRFGQGVFRMRPDGSSIEFLHQFNNNTWGLGFDATGEVFGSTANGNPSFYGALSASAAEKLGTMMPSAAQIFDTATIYPITPNVRQVDWFGAYTAGSGHAFATSDGFPERYRDRVAFIAEPTAHLLGQYEIERDGEIYAAKNKFSFLAAADEWVSPVQAEVGPDGALWVSDWYNFIIQHNPTPSSDSAGYDAENGPGNAHVNPNRDKVHGRIYRVVWDGAPEPRRSSLAGADDATLVGALDDPNQFWRLTAQRLLVDGQRTGAVSQLKARAARGGVGAIHALWTLKGLGALDNAALQRALGSEDADVRKTALRALDGAPGDAELIRSANALDDPDLIVRRAAFEALARFAERDAVAHGLIRAAAGKIDPDENVWLERALKLAAAVHGVSDEEAGRPVSLGIGEAPQAGRWWIGARIYNNPASGCVTCHSINGEGGQIGPALDRIGALRDEEYLRRALLDPNADIAEGYGDLDAPSQMPPATALLNVQEIEHVLEYLKRLGTEE